MKLSSNVLRAPVSVKTALPEAARALEEAWQRRRQELAGWQPSGGWLAGRPFPRKGDAKRS